MNKILLFDCRSFSAFFRYLSFQSYLNFRYSSVVLLLPKEVSIKDYYLNMVMLPLKTIVYESQSNDLSFFLNGSSNILDNLKPYSGKYESFDLITSFPKGNLYSILKLFTLKSSIGKILMFDDGYMNINSKSFLKNDNLLQVFINFLKKLLYSTRGFKWTPKFDVEDVSEIFTAFPQSASRFYHSCKIVDISQVRKLFYQSLSAELEISPKSFLFLGHHAVESKRLRLSEYQKMVVRLVEDNDLLDSVCYFSLHPAENPRNAQFYESLGMKPLSIHVPAEVAVSTGLICKIIAPYNTTLFECEALNLLGPVQEFVGYSIPGSPLLADRIYDTELCCRRNQISHKGFGNEQDV